MSINISKNSSAPAPGKTSTAMAKVPRSSALEVVLLLVMIILFGVFVYKPKKAEMDTKKAKLVQFKEESDALSKNVAKLKQLVADLKKSSDKIVQLEEALPLRGNAINLEMLIDKLAKTSGVAVGDISVGGKSNGVVAGNKTVLENPFAVKRSVQKMLINLTVNGTPEQLQAFLIKLEKNARIMNILGIEVVSDKDGGLNLRLNMEAYSYE